MRHGIAENGDASRQDTERRLTPEGRARMAMQAAWMLENRVSFSAVVSSPLVRAHQTATIIAEAFGLVPTVDAALACGSTPDDVLEILSQFGPNDVPLLVGHQPDLSTSVAVLSGKHVSFAQGDLAVLERTASGVGLVRHYPAEAMRT